MMFSLEILNGILEQRKNKYTVAKNKAHHMLTINIHGINPMNKRSTQYVVVIKELSRHDPRLVIIQTDTTTIETTVNKFPLSFTQILKSYKKIISQIEQNNKTYKMKQNFKSLKKNTYQHRVKGTT